MKTLKNIIDNTELSAKPILPIGHITTWHNFEAIISEGLLKTNNVEQNGVVYFFYGVPFYKLKGASKSTSERFRRPIGLLFRANLIEKASKIFPFDSGGYKKYFKPFFPEDYTLEKFEISPVDLETPGKIVSLFYKNNDNYLFGEPNINNSPKETIIDCIFNLISNKDNKKFDERNHAIEIQFSDNININGNLEIIVFPRVVYNENKRILNCNPDIFKMLFYEDSYRFDPEADCLLIKAKVKEYLRENKMICEQN